MKKTVEAYGVLDPDGELLPATGDSQSFFWTILATLGMGESETAIEEKLTKVGYKIVRVKIKVIEDK